MWLYGRENRTLMRNNGKGLQEFKGRRAGEVLEAEL